MKYKVGDKVRILKVGNFGEGTQLGELINEIGIVYDTFEDRVRFPYTIQFTEKLAPWHENHTCVFKEDELAKVNVIGQQLLLFEL
jgi:hypothetical protein